ncbi:hypothetical protein ACVWZL_003275 [Bradyrhizobium sp. GM2.4]
MTSRTKEQNREYMREYMRRRRGSKRPSDVSERRPIVPPPARYADLTATILRDPPIGRRALDAKDAGI